MESSRRSSSGKGLPVQLSLDHVSPATRLLEKERQMAEVEEALDLQKKEYAEREEAFKRREEALRKKDLELQESLINFNKFLKENENKKNKAHRKADEEAKQKMAREAQILALRKELQQKQQELQDLIRKVKKYEKYQKFLKSVEENQEYQQEYSEIEDILNRYSVLMDAQNDLMQREKKATDENNRLRAYYQQYTKEQTTMNLGLNNESAKLQSLLEDKKDHTAELEKVVDEQMKAVTTRTLQISKIMMSVENLYIRCKGVLPGLKNYDTEPKTNPKNPQFDGQPHVLELERKKQDTIFRLETIANYITDFQELLRLDWRSKMKTNKTNKIRSFNKTYDDHEQRPRGREGGGASSTSPQHYAAGGPQPSSQNQSQSLSQNQSQSQIYMSDSYSRTGFDSYDEKKEARD